MACTFQPDISISAALTFRCDEHGSCQHMYAPVVDHDRWTIWKSSWRNTGDGPKYHTKTKLLLAVSDGKSDPIVNTNTR